MAKEEEEFLQALDISGSELRNDDSIETTGRFYPSEIVPTPIEIFSKIPLTTCILNKSFDLPIDQQPTSSATEANFRVVNWDLFGEKKRICLDGWLETHLQYLLGKSKAEEVHEDAESSDGEKTIFESNELEYDSLSEYGEEIESGSGWVKTTMPEDQ